MHLLLTSASLLLVIAVQTAQSVCNEPPEVKFASVIEKSDDTYSVGTIVTYVCQFGYVASGKSRNIRCVQFGQDAEWTETQFSCMPQSCGDPGFVRNGQRVGSLFTFPNSVTFHCDTGYNIRGITKRYCQTSGTWSGKLPVCEVVKCDPPEDTENGNVIISSLEYGSELSYKCDRGFSLDTDETVYCTEDGSWSRTNVTCIETICEIPEKPQYGYVRFRGTEERPRAGSIAIFSCEGQRIASGPTTSKCLENGVWTFPPPECLEPCTIPYVSNGAIGKQVREGYPRRNVFRQIEIGKRIKDNEELYLRCSQGFEGVGSGNRDTKIFCSVGKWSTEPLCQPASCKSKVPYAANAEVADINRKHGGTVSYSCFLDYRKVTDETVTCDHGTWKGYPPTCKSTKCSTATLKNPGLLKSSKPIYSEGQVFEVNCEHRYQLAEGHSGQLMCEDGIWKGDLHPCIAANCSDHPPSIEHASVKDTYNMVHGAVAKYVCDYPYVLVGVSLVQCAFGEWVGELPRCEDIGRCYLEDLRRRDHVSPSSLSFALSGDRASIICDEGYMAESRLPFCRNGQWDSNHLSLCKESDCIIPRIYGGSIKEQILGEWYFTITGWKQSLSLITISEGRAVPSNKELWFYCNHPSTVLGGGKVRTEIKCLGGKWSMYLLCLRAGETYVTTTAKPVSIPITPTLASSRGNVATTAEYIPPSTTRSSWDEGLSSVNVDEEKPQAIVTTYAPTEPPVDECFCEYPIENNNIVAHAEGKRLIYRDRVRNGSSVEFRCLHVGYDRFRGRREITCSDCQPWHTSDFPHCLSPQKGDAVILLNSRITVLANGNIELQKGDSFNFTCVAMETAIYPEWNAPKLSGISHIRERKEREVYGDVVYFTHLQIQNADYEHEGTYECSIEGKHETMIRIIVIDPYLTCPEIPEEDEIIVKYKMERRVGSKAFFSCSKKGQDLIGKPDLTCLKSGKWSDLAPHCSGIRCERLKTTDLLQIEYSNDREVGSIATYHCALPGKRTGVPRTECLENGTWADPTPVCEKGESYVPSTAASLSKNSVSTLERSSSSSTTSEKFVVHSTTTDSRDVDYASPVDVGEGKPRAVTRPYSSTLTPTEECFCKYPLDENSDIVAYSDGKRLTFGDRVRNGSKVIFHCLHVGYHRFRGQREITCSNCDPWHSSLFPSCTTPVRGDAIIVISKDVNVLKDGNIEIHKGQSINFTCLVMETAVYPEWSVPKLSSISFIRERTERKDYDDVLYLSHLQIRNADYENGGTYECSAESNHKTMIRTVITDPRVRCPEIPGNDDIIVRYEMERREKSKAWFSCPKKGQELFGKSVLTCLRSGEWSDPPPYCSADCKIPTVNGGSFKEEKLGDWYWTWIRWERNVTYITIPSGRVVPSGTVLWFYCDKPYSVDGDGRQKVQIRCSRGRWPKDLQCLHGVPRCFLNVDPSSHLLIQPLQGSYRLGEFVLLSCPPGKETSKNVERLMCLGGNWSDSLPFCEDSKTDDQP